MVTPNEPPETKFAPVIVTGVPPAVGPEGGAMLVNVGAEAYIGKCTSYHRYRYLAITVGYYDVDFAPAA